MPDRRKIVLLERIAALGPDALVDIDNLTSLAAQLLAAPVSVVTFIRLKRGIQYIVSEVGLAQGPGLARTMPIRYSFCRHVCEADAPFIVQDAMVDHRVSSSPAVTDHGVRSYVGAPVHNLGGKAVGALCCIDFEPRTWSEAEIRTLSQIAQSVDALIRASALNVQLERANQKLDEIAKARAGFLAHMSHELRTPLTGVVGASRLLSNMDLAPEARPLTEILDRSARRVLDTVNDILDLAKIDADEIEVYEEPSDLKQLVDDVVRVFEGMASEKGVSLRHRFELPRKEYLLDGKLLGSVLQNLVSNAVKFTSSGSVDVCCGHDDDANVEISVTDTGIGIPAARHEAIFDEFQQSSPNTAREFGGTGIGLAIVKKQVELMGGEITLESVEGEGSTFRVHLPLEPVVESKTSVRAKCEVN